MTIHETLRQLRLQKGMTQEQAAEQLGLTRQAVSSYESGRTRPDVEMLTRIAALYDTDLEGVLYGTDRHLKELRRIRTAAKVLLILLPVLAALGSACLWIADRFFALEEGQLSPEEMVILRSRMKLTGAWGLLDGTLLLAATLGFLLLLILLVSARRAVPWKQKLGYVLVLSAAVLLAALVFGLTDPVYSLTNYLLTPLRVCCRAGLFLSADLILERVLRRGKT